MQTMSWLPRLKFEVVSTVCGLASGGRVRAGDSSIWDTGICCRNRLGILSVRCCLAQGATYSMASFVTFDIWVASTFDVLPIASGSRGWDTGVTASPVPVLF